MEAGAKLSSVAFGGAAAPSQARLFTAGTDAQPGAWGAKEGVSYRGADGKFDKAEAARLRKTNEMALQLGDLAEQYTQAERVKFFDEVDRIREAGGAVREQLAGEHVT